MSPDKPRASAVSRRPWVTILAAAALVMLVLFGQVPGSTRLSQAIQNAGHVPAFFALALLVRSWHRNIWVVLGICVGLGVAIEFAQALLGGDASVMDVLADALGTFAGVAFAQLSKSLGVLSLALGLAPLIVCLGAYANRSAHFPALAVFDSPLDLYFFKSQQPALTIRGKSLLVTLPKEEWPGVTLEEPAPDWSGYRTLHIDLTNPGDAALLVTVRVHDRAHNYRLEDRYNASFELVAHTRQQLRIPLDTIRNAPRGRTLDLTRVAGLILFSSSGAAGRSFYVNRIALE